MTCIANGAQLRRLKPQAGTGKVRQPASDLADTSRAVQPIFLGSFRTDSIPAGVGKAHR